MHEKISMLTQNQNAKKKITPITCCEFISFSRVFRKYGIPWFEDRIFAED